MEIEFHFTENLNRSSNYLLPACLVFLSIPGLLVYSALFLTLIFNRQLFTNPYYSFMTSLSISNATVLALFVLYGAPSTFTDTVIGGIRVNAFIGAANNVAWFAGIPMYPIISLNRFISFKDYTLTKKVYTKRNTVLMISFSWLYGLTYGIISYISCCYFLYFLKSFSFQWDTVRYGSTIMSYVDLSNSLITLVVCFRVNMCTFSVVRKSNNTVRTVVSFEANIERHKAEKKLFVLFFIITTWFLVDTVIFTIVPLVTTSEWSGVFINVVNISTLSIDGIVNLFYNNVIWKLFYTTFIKNNKTTVPIS